MSRLTDFLTGKLGTSLSNISMWPLNKGDLLCTFTYHNMALVSGNNAVLQGKLRC